MGDELELLQKIQFHKTWTNVVKRSLGASYVSWERYKDNYQLKLVMIEKSGNKKTLYVPSPNPDSLDKNAYQNLINKFHEQNGQA